MNSPLLSPHPRDVVTRKALIVWTAAVLVYIVAITGRTSFGVASVDAIDRFQVDASRIAVFTSVQVGVYALAQIPMGMLIDRLGPRRMLVYGAVIMAVGQILLGFTTSYWVAIGARVLIGAGDATAFLSVMRILPYWFPLKKTPLFTQMTSALGQLGQFISAVPFLAILQGPGWATAFISLGAVGVLIALAAGVAVADSPETWAAEKARKQDLADTAAGLTPPERPEQSGKDQARMPVGRLLATVLRDPLCWQGFFNHYSGMLFQIVFTLLWGVPMMTLGMGLSPATVGLVLTLNTVASVCAGPILGPISARLGSNRILATFVMSGSIGVTWLVFFTPDEPRGVVAIIIVNIIMAAFTPSSNLGFDDIREGLDRRIVATATGMANMGGFFGAMISAQAVGLLLDFSADGQTYEWNDFRFAWLTVILAWAVGLLGLLIFRILVQRRRKAGSDADGPTTGHVRVVDSTEG